jgi:hypothetical protein
MLSCFSLVTEVCLHQYAMSTAIAEIPTSLRKTMEDRIIMFEFI